MYKRLLLGFLAVVLTSCGDDNPVINGEDAPTITVMTWNVYIGGDVQTAFTSLDNPLNLPAEVAAFWTSVTASNFPSRARAIASIIAREKPHVIGLQEVSRFLTQTPGDFLAGNPVAAQDVAIDFLDELLIALSEQGLNYTVAASVENADIEFISVTAEDIRQIDREVILARSDVTVMASQSGHYERRVTIPVFGDAVVEIPRGWVLADVAIDGVALRLVSTHLEVSRFQDIQNDQATELVRNTTPAGATVLLGDFNTLPATASQTYSAILDAGYQDSWMALSGAPGNTCCHDDNLMNDTVSLSGRIDMIFHQGDLTPISATVIGDEIEDRTPAGLWPSDHAGVVTTFSSP
jgi:endonuclease/exonuclease/phosphatase family metal-dependent hydrolase